jgi:cellulose synthase/poly-beta-1,6-N-acetylglucosamine synthase-like glycosyltransferase
VVDQRVFAGRDHVLFAILSVLSVISIAYVSGFWIIEGEPFSHPALFLFLTLPFALKLLIFECRWFAMPFMRRPSPMEPAAGWRVGVATTFVPGAEPIEMLAETLRSLVAMDYPHDTWVLDEGNEDAVKTLCAALGARHFSRKAFPKYQTAYGRFQAKSKHGNYNAWLSEIGFANYDIVIGFDPDHVPARDFLTRLLGFFNDPSVGFVQAAQVYYNQGASFVARGAAEETYGYYSSIQMTAYAMGHPIVTGCHNAHRVSALREVGGFAAHEADDLLITLHYRSAGWRGVYLPETLAVGLVPVDWPGYLAQQQRWARSVLDIKFWVKRKMFRRLPLIERVASFLHGLHYFQGVATALGLGTLGFMLITGATFRLVSARTMGLVLGVALLLQLCEFYRQRFFLQPQVEAGLHWRAAILRFAKWPFVFVAFVEAIFRVRRGYTITRKRGRATHQWSLVLAHLPTLAVLAAAWFVGWLRGVSLPPTVYLVTAAMLLASTGICLTALRSFPEPYDPRLSRKMVPLRLQSVEASSSQPVELAS